MRRLRVFAGCDRPFCTTFLGVCALGLLLTLPSVEGAEGGISLDTSRSFLMPGDQVELTVNLREPQGYDVDVRLESRPAEVVRCPARVTVPTGEAATRCTCTANQPGEAVIAARAALPGGEATAETAVRVLLSWGCAVVPSVVHRPGLGGRVWRTDLAIVNRLPWSTRATLRLDSHGFGRQREVEIGADETIEWRDVAVSLFGEPAETAVAGYLEVCADVPLMASARTYFTDVQGGTYGQSFGTVPPMGGDQHPLLPLLSSDRAFRADLGVVVHSPNAGPCAIQVSLVSPAGELLGKGIVQTHAATTWALHPDIVGSISGRGQAHAWARLYTPGACSAWPWVSLLDTRSGDPSTLAWKPRVSGTFFLPATAHRQGRAGTWWRTQLALANPSEQPAKVHVDFVPAHGSRVSGPTLELAPQHAMMWQDVLEEVMGVTPHDSTAGTLELHTESGVVAVAARTYTSCGRGTCGDAVPIIDTSRDYGVDERSSAIVPQLRNDHGFRTNLSLFNASDLPGTVRLTLVGRRGGVQGSCEVGLGPREWRQVPDLFAHLGVTGDHDVAYLRVERVSGYAAVHAHASVIDSVSGDSVMMAMQTYPTRW